MGKLTTHILDTSAGRPGAGVRVSVYRLNGEERGAALNCTVTNADGRCDEALLSDDDFTTGVYELAFEIGDYFAGQGTSPAGPRFLDIVIVRVGVADQDAHYHVPLLVSPFGYSTYRGS